MNNNPHNNTSAVKVHYRGTGDGTIPLQLGKLVELRL